MTQDEVFDNIEDSKYNPPSSTAIVAMVGFIIVGVGVVISLILDFRLLYIYKRLTYGSSDLYESLMLIQYVKAFIIVISIIGAITAYIAFCVWLKRIYESIFKEDDYRNYPPIWSVVGWLIPVMNFFVPLVIVIRVWKGLWKRVEPDERLHSGIDLPIFWWIAHLVMAIMPIVLMIVGAYFIMAPAGSLQTSLTYNAPVNMLYFQMARKIFGALPAMIMGTILVSKLQGLHKKWDKKILHDMTKAANETESIDLLP
ncbi:MAG: DUF4328 domain-containing protein [Flavobacteriales bacterium]|nr:DUF4328 domain-containing protein [Flavobacteriales bacterium]